MKAIDEYLESLYKNDKTKEIIELKEEMRNHLIESVSELKNEGYSDSEAITIGISRFDGGEDMIKDLDIMIYNKSKKSLNISKLLFILSIILTISSFLLYKCEENRVFNIFEEVENVVTDIASTKDITKPETYKVELDKLMSGNKYKSVLDLYIYNGVSDKTLTIKDNVEYFDSIGLKKQYSYKSNLIGNSYGDSKLTNNKYGEQLWYETSVTYKGIEIYNLFMGLIIISIFTLTIYIYNLISFNNKKN